MAFSKHGKYWYAEDSWRDYEKVPWSTINDSSRRKIMKHLIPEPAGCPFCGAESRIEERYGAVFGGDGMSERVLILVNRSGRLKLDLDDWYWTCRECYQKEQREKNPRYPVKFGDKLKPWSELTRKARVNRILKLLPMTACGYCGDLRVELISLSGEWLDPDKDIEDYDWVCRSHAIELSELLHEKPHTINNPVTYPDPDLMPWLQYTAAGTIQGPSILEKHCAMGRFFHIRKPRSHHKVRT